MHWIAYVLIGIIAFQVPGKATEQDEKRPTVSVPEPTKKRTCAGTLSAIWHQSDCFFFDPARCRNTVGQSWTLV